MVWAAMKESGESPLFLIDQEVKLNQQNYQDDILIDALLPWAQKYFIKLPGLFNRTSNHHMGRKRLKSGFSRMFHKEEWLYLPSI